MEITAQMVKELREKTGIGFNKCREALINSEGDLQKAIDHLRKKGLETAAKKSGRETRDGLVRVATNDTATIGAMLEVNCESDFVARNEAFQALTQNIIDQIISMNDLGSVTPADSDKGIETLLAAKYVADDSQTIDAALKAIIAKIGENMRMRRMARFDLGGQTGYIGTYIHMGGKMGVMVESHCGKPETASNEKLHALVKDLCMQVAATNPVCVSREQMPAEIVEKEREIYTEQVKGKPADVINKIVEGKLNKLLYAEKCILEQPFVKEPKQTIKALVEATSKELGDEISIIRFARYELGAEE